jgi:hypothetical protein
MTRILTAAPLTREAFAPFGDVLDTDWPTSFRINSGKASASTTWPGRGDRAGGTRHPLHLPRNPLRLSR